MMTATPTQNLTVEDQLEQSAAYINQRWAVYETAALEIGQELAKVRDLIESGQWTQWIEDNFAFSLSTAEKLMQAAKTAPELAGLGNEQIHRKALYMLMAGSVSEEARQWALEQAERGQVIDAKLAFIAANAPPKLKARWVNEDITKDQAHALTVALRKYKDNPSVASLAIQFEVTHAETVHFLRDAYERYIQVSGPRRENTSWGEILHNKGHLMINGDSIPLKEATGRDCERYLKHRQWQHIEASRHRREEVRQFYYQDREIVASKFGTVVITNLPPGARVKITAYIEGEPAMHKESVG